MRSTGIFLSAALIAAALAAGAGARTDALTREYGGLGASVAAFYASNPRGSGEPPLGVAYYHVTATKRGRVTAFKMAINSKPATGPRGRLALVSGLDIPADATETKLNSTYCLVWHSRRLGKLIGMSYAAATTTRYSNEAEMRAERRPHC